VIWKIVGYFILAWLIIYAINHPDAASAHVHNAWHALFGSAG
jgi:hypothetical protein